MLYVKNKYISGTGKNVYINNSAPYGPDLGSYPKTLVVKFVGNNDYYNNITN